MTKVLLVLGDVSDAQVEPLRVALVRAGQRPKVTRVPSSHRYAELVRTLIGSPQQEALGQFVTSDSDDFDDEGVDDEQFADLERDVLVTLLQDQGVNLNDVSTVLIECRPATDEADPWEWVESHLPVGAEYFQLRLSERADHLWIEAADGTGYPNLTKVQIPLSR